MNVSARSGLAETNTGWQLSALLSSVSQQELWLQVKSVCGGDSGEESGHQY